MLNKIRKIFRRKLNTTRKNQQMTAAELVKENIKRYNQETFTCLYFPNYQ